MRRQLWSKNVALLIMFATVSIIETSGNNMGIDFVDVIGNVGFVIVVGDKGFFLVIIYINFVVDVQKLW